MITWLMFMIGGAALFVAGWAVGQFTTRASEEQAFSRGYQRGSDDVLAAIEQFDQWLNPER